MEQQEKNSPQVTITFNKDTVMNILVVLTFVMLLVFGWQLHELKEQVNGGSGIAKAGQVDQQPTAAAPSQPTAPVVVDLTITNDDHIKGESDAKVTIVEYSDFECPFCNRALPTVNEILDTYGDDVRLVYRHFPLRSIHANAQKAAEASECAADQGKFWEYHDLMFENSTLVSGGVPQFKKWASELGLKTATFDNCLDSGEKVDDVDEDFATASANGVQGTPAFFINGTSLSGAQPFAAFKTIIDAELAK